MKFEIDKKKYIDTHLVNEGCHPEYPLVIYNYSQECQFSKSWDDMTKMCRGLIVNKNTKEIVARPFIKFFNYEQHLESGEKLPSEVPNVYPKFDGSLGILYWWGDKPHIATRGSFISDQAIWATKFIQRPDVYGWVEKLDREYTHLFEIIYPENRVVVSYGDMKYLVHLASIHTETGKSIEADSDFPLPDKINFSSYEELKALNTPNEEGFVLHYPQSDFRLKIKFSEYVKLHKVVTGLSQIGLWEMLKDGKDIIQIIEGVPDEMHDWVQKVISQILEKFLTIERIATQIEMQVKDLATRKEQAEIVTKSELSGVVFSMLDGKDYKSLIWKMVRPRGIATFRKDIDS